MEDKKQIIRKANVNVVYQKGDRLIVNVIKKLPLSDLKNQDIVPRIVDGLQTDVIEIGEITDFNYKKYRPVMGGISCIESNKGSGTLGVIVKDATTGGLAGLTCNHCAGTLFDIEHTWPVYGNTALSHIKMYQPSPNDGGESIDSLGAPIRAIPTQYGDNGNNLVDAAIIEIPYDMAKTDIQNIHIGPFQFIEDKLGYEAGTEVWKNGRTTDFTQGSITATEVDAMVTSGSDYAYYSDLIMMDLEANPGDSGSIIFVKSQGIWKIIGILTAGIFGSNVIFACNIVDVASLLQIEAWNGNIISPIEYPYIMARGRCYQYSGYNIAEATHDIQRNYTNCAACKADAYPNKKVHMVT